MRQQFTSLEAHGFESPTTESAFSSSSSISSSSSASDRRLKALARHFVDSSPVPAAVMDSHSQNPNDTVSPSPTSSAFHADSVFAHLVRAPEDPILGVISLSLSLYSLFYLSMYMYVGRYVLASVWLQRKLREKRKSDSAESDFSVIRIIIIIILFIFVIEIVRCRCKGC